MMGFVQNVASLPPPFDLWVTVGCVLYVQAALSLVVAAFLSMGSKTPLMPKDRRHMCEISKIEDGTRQKKDSFIIRKNLGRPISSPNKRRLHDSSSR